MIGRFGRRFSSRRLQRAILGKLKLPGLLGLGRDDRDEALTFAYRLVNQDRFDDAESVYRLVLTIWSDDNSALLGLGVCRQNLGDLPQAAACYDEVARRSPDDFHARLNRAEVFVLDGDKAAARAELTAVSTRLGKTAEHARLRSRLDTLMEIATEDESTRPGKA